VRQELEYAIRKGKTIIPINPDRQFVGYPKTMPRHLEDSLKSHQYSAVDTIQLYQESIDKLIKQRIRPALRPVFKPKHVTIPLVLFILLALCYYVLRVAIPNYYIQQGDRCMQPDENYLYNHDSALVYYNKALQFGASKAYAKIAWVYESLGDETNKLTTYDWVAYEDTAVYYYRLGAYAGDP
jgi:hypothetical protein